MLQKWDSSPGWSSPCTPNSCTDKFSGISHWGALPPFSHFEHEWPHKSPCLNPDLLRETFHLQLPVLNTKDMVFPDRSRVHIQEHWVVSLPTSKARNPSKVSLRWGKQKLVVEFHIAEQKNYSCYIHQRRPIPKTVVLSENQRTRRRTLVEHTCTCCKRGQSQQHLTQGQGNTQLRGVPVTCARTEDTRGGGGRVTGDDTGLHMGTLKHSASQAGGGSQVVMVMTSGSSEAAFLLCVLLNET